MQKSSARSQSSTRILELREYEPLYLAQSELSRELAETIWRDYSSQIAVDFPSPRTKDCWRLTSQGYVGAIALAPDFQLYLLPKIPLKNIFHLWEVAYNFEIEPGRGFYQCQSVADFYNMLAALLARRVLDCQCRGLARDYQTRNEELAYVRGKINLQKWQNKDISRVPCRYQMQTVDCEDNQILLCALSLILKSHLCSNATANVARRALRGLETVTLQQFSADDCVHRKYDRSNFDYQSLHALCRFFLEGSSPTHQVGEYSMLPFLINMERLFEQFLGEWLRRNLPAHRTLQTQHRVPLENNFSTQNELAFRIDFVVNTTKSGETIFVADAKYKAASQPSTQDIAQVVAYAKAKHCHHAILIYPQLQKPLDILVGDVRVRSVVFDLAGDWQQSGEKFLRQLLEV